MYWLFDDEGDNEEEEEEEEEGGSYTEAELLELLQIALSALRGVVGNEKDLFLQLTIFKYYVDILMLT